MRPIIKRIIIGLVLAALVFVLLNADFFFQNLRYKLSNKSPAGNTRADSNVPLAEPDTLWIDSLGIRAPIIYIDQTGETAFQEALQNGVVHYPGTPLPGQAGNVYIFGHSSDLPFAKGNYKTIFALLPQIDMGAEIKITDRDGRQFTYIVTGTKVVSPDQTQYLQSDNSGRKVLTVQTSYPVGTALRRFLVFAESAP